MRHSVTQSPVERNPPSQTEDGAPKINSRLLWEVDGLAGRGGAAGSVEDFDDDEVGFEGRESVGFRSIDEDGAKIGEGIVVGSGDGRRGASGRLRFVGQAHRDIFCGDGDDRAGAAVNFHIFA